MIATCLRIIILVSLSVYQAFGQSQKHTFSLGDTAFLLDNKPFLMISGEMHYPRIPPESWRDRMKMAKAMGLNTIGTYVFWNAHEPMPGKYDFNGNNNIAAFLQAAKDEGLWVVLRPSPYACAEWEFGGYPWWLLRDSTVKVRSKDPRFITAYRNYIQELAKQIVPHLLTNGGNVLMIQIENEYGSYSNDKSYLDLNRQLFMDAGFNCTLFTCDGADKMADGHLPGYLPAVNGLEDPAEVKKLINKYHNGKGPYYVAEWYPGWFDNWGKPHATVSAKGSAEKLDKILGAGISINMYMFHGGTTRGFMNGANMNINDPYSPQVSSYDYDAPLDEAGNPTEKYHAFREVIAKHLPAGQVLPAIPAKKKTIAIERIMLSGYANLFDPISLPAPLAISRTPLSFEDMDQAYGLVLYRATLGAATTGYLKVDDVRDYAIIYINGKQAGILDRRLKQDSVFLKNIPKAAVLDILVENNGRVNYGPYLTDNRKGIIRKVTLNGIEVNNWKMYGFPFNDPRRIRFVAMPNALKAQPASYKGYFTLDDTGDTWLDMRSFGKGFVFLNGHHLGRYWQIGPQQTLYVPAGWLKKGVNEIIVFDALKWHHSISTLPGPVLSHLSASQVPPAPYGPLPSAAQLAWHEMEMYCLVHFGVDTYTDKEWGFGDEDPAIFNPTQFNAQQIVKAAKAGGFKGVIVVAKHHDGLCLWPTETTPHNITKTSWKNGKADMVEEFRKACEKEGMKLGLYCSPWDRNSPWYGKPEYVNIYREQLKELYSKYGPLFISWHDGANGGDGYYGGARERRTIDRSVYYGWDTTWQIIREMQPSAVIFGDIGPDVRWVGNEEGHAGETCWATYTPEAPESGKKPSYGYVKYEQGVEGTRNGKYWMPAECDVPLRPGWFYHASQDNQVKSPGTLLDLYYKSVGRGANLDLGIAPDRRGLLHDNDVKALEQFGELLNKTFMINLAKDAKLTASNTRYNDKGKYGPSFLLDEDRYSYWATDDRIMTAQLIIDLVKTQTFDVIRLRENIKLGQRIDSFAVDVLEKGQWKQIAKGTSIGANRLVRLPKQITAKQLRLRITGAQACIVLSDFGLFKEPALLPATETGSTITRLSKAGWKTIANTGQDMIIDMGAMQTIKGFAYLPRQDKKTEGVVDKYSYAVSKDGKQWEQVAAGEFSNIRANPIEQVVQLKQPVQARYFKFSALHLIEGDKMTAAELGVY